MVKMKNTDGTWTEVAKRLVWNKAPIVDKCDSLRYDSCKAIMEWDKYGNRMSDYGWEIDHIVSKQLLDKNWVPEYLIDHIDNLRLMHYKNNIRKGENFPLYSASVCSIGNDNHFDVYRDYCVNADQFNVLRQLYADYLNIERPQNHGRWQMFVDREIKFTDSIPTIFFDEIIIPSIHDLD